MSRMLLSGILLAALLPVVGCRSNPTDRSTTVFLIENSPTNLDPRIGVDAQSEHIDELMFDGLVVRDENYRMAPGLAESWEQPDPLTLIFHLRAGVVFSDGRPLTSKDVVWTLNSMRDGTVITPKASSYASIAKIEAPDERTVILRLKSPDNFLLSNLSSGAMGIVPAGIDPSQVTVNPSWQNPNNLPRCPQPSAGCAVQVEVRYKFNFLFPVNFYNLSPVKFEANTINMSSTSQMIISR